MTAVKEKKAKPELFGNDASTLDMKPDKATQALPPPKPGEPGFDWTEEYPGEDVFVFTASDGTTVGLAAAAGNRKLKPGDFRKMMHLETWQQNFYLIEKVASPAALAISDDLDDKDYADMIGGWTEWSGTSAGES